MSDTKLNPSTRNIGYRDKRYIYTLNYEQNLLLRYLLDKTIEDLPEIADKYMNTYDLINAMNNFEIIDLSNKDTTDEIFEKIDKTITKLKSKDEDFTNKVLKRLDKMEEILDD